MNLELTTENVAAFLQRHPEFFNDYAELLSDITIPHPHGGRAISLSERQMQTLREKNKILERKLAEVIYHGQQNDMLEEKMQHWTCALLEQEDAQYLPSTLLIELSKQFDIADVALRLWGLKDIYSELTWTQPVAVDTILFVNHLIKPYCGVVDNQFEALKWLPGAGQHIQSIALIALRLSNAEASSSESFGLLVLGDRDSQRFSAVQGTLFLERIGAYASAALARMVD